MLRMLMAVAAIVAILSFGGRPALAYGDAPWCAVTTVGAGEVHWECEYWSIEACRPHVIAGNRGFCNQSPWYKGPVKRAAPRHHRHRR